jgi:hypothetical protein
MIRLSVIFQTYLKAHLIKITIILLKILTYKILRFLKIAFKIDLLKLKLKLLSYIPICIYHHFIS